MPGPAAQRAAQRTNARPDWVVLPAAGRPGKPPAWPISDAPATPAHASRWRDLWRLPQAVEWQRLNLERSVARLVILLAIVEDVEDGRWTAAVLSEARQLEDRLGLSPWALKKLQWEIAEVAPVVESADSAGVTSLDRYRDL